MKSEASFVPAGVSVSHGVTAAQVQQCHGAEAACRLSDQLARDRLAKFGVNVLTARRRHNPMKRQALKAADLLLTDDDFSADAGAVQEGRVVFDNIKTSLQITLPPYDGSAGVILIPVEAEKAVLRRLNIRSL